MTARLDHGPILPLVFRLTVPAVIAQLITFLYNIVDRMYVAKIPDSGMDALAALGIVLPITLMIQAFANLVGLGGAPRAGIRMGEGRTDEANRIFNTAFLLLTVLGVTIGALTFVLARPMLRLCYGSIEADVLDAGVLYLKIIALSYPFLALYNGGAALYRSMGNSKISMQISILMNIINIVGNAVCIFGLKMGVDGVAWPSVISRVVAAVLILGKCYQKGQALNVPKTTRLDARMTKRILGIGIPSAFENSLFQAGRILVVSMISAFGTVQIAANAVANNLDGMGTIPGKALGLAMITVVGRCIGAGDSEQAVYYTKKLLVWAYIAMGVFNGAILLFLPQIVSIYALSGATMQLAILLVQIHAGFAILLWTALLCYARMLCTMLCIYAACMVGHLFRAHNGVAGVGAFFLMSWGQGRVENLLNAGGFVRILMGSAGDTIVSEAANHSTLIFFAASFAITAVFGAVYFILTCWLMKNKLNLE